MAHLLLKLFRENNSRDDSTNHSLLILPTSVGVDHFFPSDFGGQSSYCSYFLRFASLSGKTMIVFSSMNRACSFFSSRISSMLVRGSHQSVQCLACPP